MKVTDLWDSEILDQKIENWSRQGHDLNHLVMDQWKTQTVNRNSYWIHPILPMNHDSGRKHVSYSYYIWLHVRRDRFLWTGCSSPWKNQTLGVTPIKITHLCTPPLSPIIWFHQKKTGFSFHWILVGKNPGIFISSWKKIINPYVDWVVLHPPFFHSINIPHLSSILAWLGNFMATEDFPQHTGPVSYLFWVQSFFGAPTAT